jgi:hypothetical protein
MTSSRLLFFITITVSAVCVILSVGDLIRGDSALSRKGLASAFIAGCVSLYYFSEVRRAKTKIRLFTVRLSTLSYSEALATAREKAVPVPPEAIADKLPKDAEEILVFEMDSMKFAIRKTASDRTDAWII